MKRSLPPIKNDKDAEALLEQDLSDYLHEGNFQAAKFEFMPKTAKINLRVPEPLLKVIKKRAKNASMPYQRYMRQLLEHGLAATER